MKNLNKKVAVLLLLAVAVIVSSFTVINNLGIPKTTAAPCCDPVITNNTDVSSPPGYGCTFDVLVHWSGCTSSPTSHPGLGKGQSWTAPTPSECCVSSIDIICPLGATATVSTGTMSTTLNCCGNQSYAITLTIDANGCWSVSIHP